MKKFFRMNLTAAVLILIVSAINASAATFTVTNTNDSGAGSLSPTICTAQPANLVSWYQGEDNPIDFIGTNNGTIQGNVTFADGFVNRTFTLGGNGNTSGSGDRVIVGNPANLQLQDFTIEAWIKRSSSTIVTNSPVVPFEGGTFFAYGTNGYGFFIDQATNRLGLTKIGVSSVTSTATVTDTNFHHVAVTKSGNQVTFYVDGVAAAPVTYNITFTFGTNAAIGARGDNDARNAFFGSIDELSIYNRALTASEIQAIVAAGSAGKCFMVNTFTVTNTNDSGTGSLRQAILDANAATGADAIKFDTSVFSTPQIITLTSGELLITNSVNSTVIITGPGANLLTVSGNNASRIFTVLDTPVVSISGMTLTGGNGVGSVQNDAGGAIHSQGNLTLTNMVITLNTTSGFGGGVLNETGDSLTIVNSTISNNTAGNQGGGIHNNSQFLNITNSTITENSANREGGGLFASGLGVSAANPISISGSTFSNNSITGPSPTGGGGIGFFNITANITNTTISGNTSASNGGGIRSFRTTLTLSYTTIAGNTSTANGGGIARLDTGSTTFLSTIIGNNSAGGTGPDLNGTFISSGYNLIKNTTGATISGTLTGNIYEQDPFLLPLADNGGPTRTHRPQLGSTAIDGGDPGNFPATDQRGVARPLDGYPGTFVAQPDIGAYEVAATPPTAATVSVSGRVLTPDGRGLRNATVWLTDTNGGIRAAHTNTFGFFRFNEIAAGATYIFSVQSKRYVFAERVVSVTEDLSDFNFYAAPPAWSVWNN